MTFYELLQSLQFLEFSSLFQILVCFLKFNESDYCLEKCSGLQELTFLFSIIDDSKIIF